MAYQKKQASQAEQIAPVAPAVANVDAPVVVIWNMPRVRMVHFPIAADRANGRQTSSFIRLNPGANQLSSKDWAALQTRKDVQQQLQRGELRLVKSFAGKALNKIPRTLESLPPAEAVVLVENTADENQLSTWAKTETRGEVAKAIKDQLEKIEAAVKTSKDE